MLLFPFFGETYIVSKDWDYRRVRESGQIMEFVLYFLNTYCYAPALLS